jgi:hypothetical protein
MAGRDMKEMRNKYILVEKREENHLGDIEIDGRTTLKRILNTGVDWIHLAH